MNKVYFGWVLLTSVLLLSWLCVTYQGVSIKKDLAHLRKVHAATVKVCGEQWLSEPVTQHDLQIFLGE